MKKGSALIEIIVITAAILTIAHLVANKVHKDIDKKIQAEHEQKGY